MSEFSEKSSQSPQVEKKEKPIHRYHPAAERAIQDYGKYEDKGFYKHSLQSELESGYDKEGTAKKIVGIDHVARYLMPEDDPASADMMERVIDFEKKTVGKDVSSPLFKGVRSEKNYYDTRQSPPRKVTERYDWVFSGHASHILRNKKSAEMNDVAGTLKAGHIAFLLNRFQEPNNIKHILRNLKEGATCYIDEDTGDGLFIFDGKDHNSVSAYQDSFRPEESKLRKETYHLSIEDQLHVINTAIIEEKFLPHDTTTQYSQELTDLLPEGAIFTEKGFVMLPGEDAKDVDERYFALRDKLAEQAQQELGTDDPLTEKQVREKYAEQQQKIIDLEQALYKITQERDEARVKSKDTQDVEKSGRESLDISKQENKRLIDENEKLTKELKALKAYMDSIAQNLEANNGIGKRGGAIATAIEKLRNV